MLITRVAQLLTLTERCKLHAMKALAISVAAVLLVASCFVSNAPSSLPPSQTPQPTGSPACGGFHLGIVNGSEDQIQVTINGMPAASVDPGGSQTLIEVLTQPALPLMPWTVVITRAADDSPLESAYFDGTAPDQTLVVTAASAEFAVASPCTTAPPA